MDLLRRPGRSVWLPSRGRAEGSHQDASPSVPRTAVTTREQLVALAEIDARRRGIGPLPADRTFFQSWRVRMDDAVFNRPYAQHPWIYAAVRAMAKPIGGVPLQLKRGRDRSAAQIVTSHPIVSLFQHVNPILNSTRLKRTWVMQLALTGESNWFLLGRSGQPVGPGEIPAEIFPFGRNQVEIELSSDGSSIDKIVLTVGRSRKIEFEPHQVIRYFEEDPDNPIRGLAPLEAALGSARPDYLASRWNEKFFQNSADPGGIITVEQTIDDEQRKALLESFEELHAGGYGERRQRTAVFDGGAKYEKLGQSHADMEFRGQKEISREEIGGVFDVPPFKLGLIQNVNRETAMTSERAFWRDNLKPKLDDFEEGFNEPMATWDGLDDSWFVEFDVSGIKALQEQLEDRVESAAALQKLSYPINSLNERFELGMPALEGGDVPLIPVGFERLTDVAIGDPLDEDDDGGGEPPPPDGDDGDDGDEPDDEPEDGDQDDDGEIDEDEDGEGGPAEESFADGLVRSPACRLEDETVEDCVDRKVPEILDENPDMDPDQAVAIAFSICEEACDEKAAQRPALRGRRGMFAAWDPEKVYGYFLKKVFLPGEKRMKSKVKRHFWRLRKHQLARLEQIASDAGETSLSSGPAIYRATPQEIEAALFALASWNDELVKLLDPTYRFTIRTTLSVLETELGGLTVFHAARPELLAFLELKEIKVVRINETVKNALRRTLLTGVQERETVQELQQRVKGIFTAASKRALAIARTETAQTVNGTRGLAFQAEGVENHQWSTSRDEVVRASHIAQEGEIRRVGELFPNGLRWPSDILGPAKEVVNCRCVALAVD